MDNKKDNSTIIKIPFDRLSAKVLDSIIEEFVTRDGTDYGKKEVPLQRKIDQVKGQIISGRAIILFDASTQTVHIIPADDPRMNDLSVET